MSEQASETSLQVEQRIGQHRSELASEGDDSEEDKRGAEEPDVLLELGELRDARHLLGLLPELVHEEGP